MTAYLKRLSENKFIHWLIQPRRLPLFYAVMVVTAIMYHYNATLTPLWLILALAMETALFQLFEFVKKHNILGGALFCIVGLITLALALVCIQVGEHPELTNGIFAPSNTDVQIDFYVWFLTPQEVINAFYAPYTVALLLLFAFFIGFTTYYFTMIQYRVLMSFSILCFPFAIYAKEDENMPILFIILLFACYFAVMIFCRQLHAEDPEVIYYYQEDALNYPLSPHQKSSSHAKASPELSDGAGWKTGAVFLTAACIVVLAIPKPSVQEDRSRIEGLINMAAFTDFLMDAISGFSDESDGGIAGGVQTKQALFYAYGEEPCNLRLSTMTTYDYNEDKWIAGEYDKKNGGDVFYASYRTALVDACDSLKLDALASRIRYGDANILKHTIEKNQTIQSASYAISPYDMVLMLQRAAEESPSFAEKWGLTQLPSQSADIAPYLHSVLLSTTTFNGVAYLAPNHTFCLSSSVVGRTLQQNPTGIIYRNDPDRVYHDVFYAVYLSDRFAQDSCVQSLLQNRSFADWTGLLLDLNAVLPNDEAVMETVTEAARAENLLLQTTASPAPSAITELAEEITEGCTSDYERACAIQEYLAFGDYTYDLDYVKASDANVETFLFESKRGVCYQFATAMTLLCRELGMPARYVEGYSMSENYGSFLNDDYNYVIRTNHAHAFTEVYIAGYGWMSFDATAPDNSMANDKMKESVLGALQYTGTVMLILSILALVILGWVVPRVQEALFRGRYRRCRNGKVVEEAFARLRKEWEADPAVTARVLCEEWGMKLHLDTQPMLEGIEAAVYGRECSVETADAVFACYCALRKAYKAWAKEERKRQRAQKKQTHVQEAA